MNALKKCRERLVAIAGEIRGIDTAMESRGDLVPNDEETATLGALVSERSALEARVATLEDEERRESAAAANRIQDSGPAPAVVLSEPHAYGPGTRSSYFLDLARVTLGRGDGDGGVDAARQRQERHQAELRTELPAREARRDEAARRQADGFASGERLSSRQRHNMFETRVNPNRTDGQGGHFVPPLWLVDDYVDLPRFGRPIANMVRHFDLPSGTDSINLPKVATGTTVAAQTADAAAVSSTDLTDTSVVAPVRTIAGQQDIAIQLLDQSPISFDEVVFADLLADYDAKLDVQVISGSGASGQVTGITATSGINTVVYTDATPTLPELWVPLLKSASLIAKNRKLPATGVALIPSIWYWALSQLDSGNRPFIVPSGVAFNPLASNGQAQAEGPAGMFTYGLPAILDGNIPSTFGGGTESRIITARWDDLYLWEGAMKTRVLSEVLSNTLQVRIQIYNYVAFMANRRPESISLVTDTGVIPVAGF